MQKQKAALALLVAACLLGIASARINKLEIDDDPRKVIYVEQFGFYAGGEINLKVEDLKIKWAAPEQAQKFQYQMGFIVSALDKDPYAFIEAASEHCLLDLSKQTFKPLTWSQYDAAQDGAGKVRFPEKEASQTFGVGEEGLYSVIFAMCGEGLEPRTHVSFELVISAKNPGNNYLSAGESPLPTVYLLMMFAFMAATGVWTYFYWKNRANVHRIHVLMSVLLGLKVFTMIFEAARWHHAKVAGRSSGLDIVYYIFATLKGLMLFLVILLIGTGYSLLKPFISGREKKVVIVCLVLQVLANIAAAVVEEKLPGDRGWFKWQDAFKLLDIICCCAILFPIVWSIRHLREASQSDGKAARNLHRLKLFRHLYLIVVSYVYFTRIILPLLEPTLPWTLTYLSNLLYELTTLVFFSVVGYKFRPVAENPYIPLRADDEDEEVGPDDDNTGAIQLSNTRV
eukprot:tig00000361_g24377.t1